MNRRLATFAFLLIVPAATSFAVAPTLFFTDIDSGPKTGGNNNDGAYVTIYGNNLAKVTSVTVGGGEAIVAVPPMTWLWYQKMVIQLGPNAATGAIVVSNSHGSSNSNLTFTVRSGNIYFVDRTTGNDNNTGFWGAPFASIIKAERTMQAGDTTYVMDGVFTETGRFNPLDFTSASGNAGNPIAMLAYPGTQPTIGSIQHSNRAALIWSNYIVLGGFKLYSYNMAIDGQAAHIKVVGNYVSCGKVDPGAMAGCLQIGLTSSQANYKANFNAVLGNEVALENSGGKHYYHGIYVGANAHDQEIAWNTVHMLNGGCRGILINNDYVNGWNFSIHDNLVYDTPCDGININSADAGRGYVNVYNNVVYRAGIGGTSGYRNCLLIAYRENDAVNPVVPTARAEVYNNTFYDCGGEYYRGADRSEAYASISIWTPANFRNNIIHGRAGLDYIREEGYSTLAFGSNNLYFGNGKGPADTAGNLNTDPLFVNAAIHDFHLQPISPAIGTGVATTATQDVSGNIRSVPFDIGAYEYVAGTSTPNWQCVLRFLSWLRWFIAVPVLIDALRFLEL